MAWGEQGSTRRWRALRRKVLERDGAAFDNAGDMIRPARCQLRLDGCTGKGTTVHHVKGMRPELLGFESMDDLESSCVSCNDEIGDPTRHDPEPRPLTNW